jgi:hypothetical protein
MSNVMTAVAFTAAIVATSISAAFSEDFTCDQWLSARNADPSPDNRVLRPLIAFVQGYSAALNQVTDALNPTLKLSIRPTAVADVLSDVDERCRRNLKASGPASIETQLKADTPLRLIPVVQAIQKLHQ